MRRRREIIDLAAATSLRQFQPLVIPGVFYLEEYARACIIAASLTGENDVELRDAGIDDYWPDPGVWSGAGDGNRTRIVSLGMYIRGSIARPRGVRECAEGRTWCTDRP